MIYADFESILVPEDNGNQNPKQSYTNKYKKYIVWSYKLWNGYNKYIMVIINYNGYNKLVCVDDKFRKLFKTYLGFLLFFFCQNDMHVFTDNIYNINT